MNRHNVMINGRNYIFVFKDNKLSLFEYVNGKPQKVNEKQLKDKNEMIQNALTGMLQIIEEEINKKIKNGEYSSLDEVTKDIKDRVGSINVHQLNVVLKEVNFETNEEYKTMLKHLSDRFSKIELEKKEQMVEENIDVDLRTLFAENGIREYEISPSKSVITYEKDGVTYTLNNTDPNSTIYEVVLQSINFDKMNSREEIDNEIARIMDLESQHTYQQNQTVGVNELEDYKRNIADYLKSEYGYTEIKGIEPADSNFIDGGWIVKLGNGQTVPIFAIKNEDGTLSITFGKEKQIDNQENLTAKPEENKKIQNEVDRQAKEEQLIQIYQKLFNGEELTEEEKQIIETYKNNEEELNKLSPEARKMFEEILETYENIKKTSENSKTSEKVLKLGEMPKPTKPAESGLAYIGVVTFLSGLITGIFVFMFFKILL